MTAEKIEQLKRVAGPVSRETASDLLSLETLSSKWSQRINLVAPSTLADLWWRHICDSAQLARLEPSAQSWLDLGSGGGYPGLVMGIFLKHRGGRIELVESNRKKAAFLGQAIAVLGVPGRVIPFRIKDAVAMAAQPEVVTARALAPLDELLGLAAPWLERGAHALFHKGRDYAAEIAESRRRWRFDLVEHPSMTEQGSAILDIRGLRPRSER